MIAVGPVFDFKKDVIMKDELWRLGAVELSEGIRSRQFSSRAVVEAHLKRIDDVNSALNAVTVRLDEQALSDADAADWAQATGQHLGALHGVPITVKENIDLKGSNTTHCVTALQGARASDDAPQIAALRSAGAIPIGRTNMPEFGVRWHTDNALRGATKNPWGADRTPGGSSGGEAAAIAAGMSPLGIGNDYAGSIRWPSQCCGITGLKPSYGRIASANMAMAAAAPPLSVQMFAVQGPLARQVKDLRLALALMSGPSGSDPDWVPAPLIGPEIERPIRVAMVLDDAGPDLEPQVAKGIHRAAEALVDAGYRIEECTPPSLNRAAELFFQSIFRYGIHKKSQGLMRAAASSGYGASMDAHWDAYMAAGGAPSNDPMLDRFAIAQAWCEWMVDYPLILAPITTRRPLDAGFDLRGGEDAMVWMRSLRMVVVANFLGLPSVATPVGESEGLPQGVQLIGTRFREDLCLDAAEAIEQRLGRLTPVDPRPN